MCCNMSASAAHGLTAPCLLGARGKRDMMVQNGRVVSVVCKFINSSMDRGGLANVCSSRWADCIDGAFPTQSKLHVEDLSSVSMLWWNGKCLTCVGCAGSVSRSRELGACGRSSLGEHETRAQVVNQQELHVAPSSTQARSHPQPVHLCLGLQLPQYMLWYGSHNHPVCFLSFFPSLPFTCVDPAPAG